MDCSKIIILNKKKPSCTAKKGFLFTACELWANQVGYYYSFLYKGRDYTKLFD